jgi:tetratricopeptide (TPR) repeat protein
MLLSTPRSTWDSLFRSGFELRALLDSTTEKAKAAYRTAIGWQGAAPADPQPFLNLGSMLAEESDYDHAIPLLLKAAVLSRDNPKVHEELGHVFEAQRNLPEAQAELERPVVLAPDTSALRLKLGRIYRRAGMNDRARQEFDLCEMLNSTHSSTSTPNPLKPDRSAPHQWHLSPRRAGSKYKPAEAKKAGLIAALSRPRRVQGLSCSFQYLPMDRPAWKYPWYRFQSLLRRGIIRGDVAMVAPGLAENAAVVREVMRGIRNENRKWHRQ